MPVTAEKPAPYGPASALLEVVNRRRDRGLAAPINADVLARAGISQSIIPRTLYGLQILDLIDEGGNPTPTFEGLRLAPHDEYKKRLEDWLKSAYSEVFSFVDPRQDDDNKIRDAFRSYNPVGQQSRMVTLFKELCAAAGLRPEKSSTGAAPKPSVPKPKPPTRAPSTAKPFDASVIAAAASRIYGGKIPPIGGAKVLHPAISGLVDSLPGQDTGWTAAERAKFLKTFEAVLDFAIPIVAKASTNENGGPE
jgi:hypothetical protein